MKAINILTLTILISFCYFGIIPAQGKTKPDSLLWAGNLRYIEGKAIHPRQTGERRDSLLRDQKPFAIILSCSDSRVPPEIIFDQGLGDLFIIRVAGNVVNNEILGSIEYAVAVLGSKLLVVLGHEECGAVDATIKGKEVPGHIPSIVRAILPAVKDIHDLNTAINANIKSVVKELKTSCPILAKSVSDGNLKIIGAKYELKSGKVKIIESRF